MTYEFLVPELPKRVIVSNRRDDRVPEGHDRNAEQSRIQALVTQSAVARWPDVPTLTRASVMLSYRSSTKRPGDGRYRTRGSVWILNGSILTAVCLGVIDAGIVDGANIVWSGAGYEPVDELEHEGLYVTVQDLV